jgi:predicted nucleotidyltransferase
MDTVKNTLSETIEIKPVELQQAIEQATNILKSAGAEAVYLFGSVVEGTFRHDSDIDFAVAGLPPAKFFQVMGQTMAVFPRSFDLVDLDVDTPFTRYLKEKGKLYRVA